MNIDEFQSKYHSYRVTTKVEALREIERLEPVIEEAATGRRLVSIIPVEFPGLGWCLMVDKAFNAIQQMDIIP